MPGDTQYDYKQHKTESRAVKIIETAEPTIKLILYLVCFDVNNNGGETSMANNNNSGSNRSEVPQAREALNRFKMEVANEIGVPLKQGYNGDLTSKQNGSVGGEMVKRMIRRQEEQMSGQSGQQ